MRNQPPDHKYRTEIDGLRALAIMPVVLYHANASWMPGGFLGVDVFFVISGFLITGILLRELSAGTFSLLRFYERRARRILPAMLVMITVTLAVSPFFAWPWQIEELAASAAASVIFMANLYFEAAVGYFRPDAETYPLLHMWSLAIEEQYYIAFPIILWALFGIRASLRVVGVTLLALTGLSLLGAMIAHSTDANATFYIVQYRAWELGAGSLTALLVFRYGRLDNEAWRVIAVIGLAVISASFVLLKAPATPVQTLPIVLSAALLLATRLDHGCAASILTSRPFRAVGLISFSLYLWHQPVFAFGRLERGDLDLAHVVFLIALSFGLAILSYRFVETPFRRSAAPRATVFRRSGIAIFATVVLALFVSSIAHFTEPRDPLDRSLAISMEARAADVVEGYFDYQDRPFPDNDKENVLLIGDSFSQDFFQMARQANAFSNANLVAHYMPGRCQPYWGSLDVSENVSPANRNECARLRATKAPDPATIEEADTIIFASRWTLWGARMIDEIIDQFPSSNAKIIVIGRKSFSDDHPILLRDYLGVPAEERRLVSAPIGTETQRISDIMRTSADGFSYVDFSENACRTGTNSCPLFTEEGYPVSHDGGHLTREGAAFFGPRLFENEALAPFVR